MHTLLLTVLFLALAAQEAEQFTLADGRVLVGTYDENSRSLTVLSGKIAATVKVHPMDIAKREIVSLPQIANSQAKNVDLLGQPVAGKKQGATLHDQLMAIEEDRRKTAEEISELEKKIAQLKTDFSTRNKPIITAIKTPIVPDIKDPRQSEQKLIDDIQEMAEAIEYYKRIAKKTSPTELYFNLRGDGGWWPMLLEKSKVIK